MPNGFGYWSDKHKNAMLARDSAEFQALQSAGPWQFVDFNFNGTRGTMAQWKQPDGAFIPESAYGKPRQLANGKWYFPSKEKLDQGELVKDQSPRGIDYTTSRNVSLTIPLAAAAPRFIAFSEGQVGSLAGSFASLASDLFEKMSAKTELRDNEIIRLVCLAISQCYRVTPEALDDLQWITSVDIDPILCCIMGSDPKALPDAGASLPLPAPGSAI